MPEVDLSPHPLAPRVDEHGARDEGDSSVIVGYIGASERDDMVRIHLDLSFNSYCEVKRADVTRTAPVDGRDPNSPSVVWVGSSAQVRLVRVGQLTGAASFVTGRIRSRYYARSRWWGPEDEPETVYPWGGICTELFDCPGPGGPITGSTGRDPLACSTLYYCCRLA